MALLNTIPVMKGTGTFESKLVFMEVKSDSKILIQVGVGSSEIKFQ